MCSLIKKTKMKIYVIKRETTIPIILRSYRCGRFPWTRTRLTLIYRNFALKIVWLSKRWFLMEQLTSKLQSDDTVYSKGSSCGKPQLVNLRLCKWSRTVNLTLTNYKSQKLNFSFKYTYKVVELYTPSPPLALLRMTQNSKHTWISNTLLSFQWKKMWHHRESNQGRLISSQSVCHRPTGLTLSRTLLSDIFTSCCGSRTSHR